MDEDLVFGIFLLFFFLIILTLPLSITACIAAFTTRKWSKAKVFRAQAGIEGAQEADRLVSESDSENELDFLDLEDEQYYHDKREQQRRLFEERDADWQLSARAKFLKEWKKCWMGPAGSREQLAKDRELAVQDERRKIAREAVREYLRTQRMLARKATKSSRQKHETAIELPNYANAIAQA